MDLHSLIIREIGEADAEAYLQLARTIDSETRFMMLEPDERMTTVEEQRQQMRAMHLSGNQTVLLAEYEGQLVGYLGAAGGRFRRNRHSAHIWIGIRREFMGQGIGTRLFEQVEAWARNHNLYRLELTVMAHNKIGQNLHTKMGFRIEGHLRHSLLVDGEYIDESQMAKLLL